MGCWSGSATNKKGPKVKGMLSLQSDRLKDMPMHFYYL